MRINKIVSLLICVAVVTPAISQKKSIVTIKDAPVGKKINIFIGDKLFTSFLYPDSLEKPVLYPINTASGLDITRGFPLNPKLDDPIDHPHHIGLWFNFENVNGLDFWNNSYKIAKEKKQLYGWVKTDKIIKKSSGSKGVLSYHARWVNQKDDLLLEETTTLIFSGSERERIIDRITTLKAKIAVTFNDSKDGLLGLRLAHQLQIPTAEDQKFTDNNGNVTIVKGGTDKIANGNFVTSAGKQGSDVWSTRAVWCKVYGKMANDSISVSIIDHPSNPNYPTFWHARGYGLFAANPLGEKLFTNGRSAKNLQIRKGESVTFKYRIVVANGKQTIPAPELDKLASNFAAE